MARIVLVRHAKSDYPWGVDDHDRPLNDRGRRDAPMIGEWLDQHVGWEPGERPLVLVSSARRAQLTWSLARQRLSGRWDAVEARDEPRIYEASTRDLRDVIAEVGTAADVLVMVGHNPGLADLVHTCAVDDALRREATAKFPTSAVAVLEADGPLDVSIGTADAFRVTDFAVPRG